MCCHMMRTNQSQRRLVGSSQGRENTNQFESDSEKISTLVIMCLLKCIFIAFYVINDEINVH